MFCESPRRSREKEIMQILANLTKTNKQIKTMNIIIQRAQQTPGINKRTHNKIHYNPVFKRQEIHESSKRKVTSYETHLTADFLSETLEARGNEPIYSKC